MQLNNQGHPSGYYWLNVTNEPQVVHCSLNENRCCGENDGKWMHILSIQYINGANPRCIELLSNKSKEASNKLKCIHWNNHKSAHCTHYVTLCTAVPHVIFHIKNISLNTTYDPTQGIQFMIFFMNPIICGMQRFCQCSLSQNEQLPGILLTLKLTT